ncbi:hypothetical protein HLRTI_003368 [Halorhabdus tiamatea SARL4B]|nr:hypothetical protein [Halorhabdus tiamatea]ERJ04681.1 hypothetical protein HLRTI_003368 [Halorhabdus tiamatea SARL4B]
MGIKCSLFGHDFGETTVERDREEQGNEVVSTIREVETCRRCGETRVVSENTEVTTIKTPEDVEKDPETTEPESDVTEPEPDSGADIVDAEADEPVTPTETGESPPPEEDMDYESAAEDDGVILEDDTDEQPDRNPGEWPDSGSPEGTERDDPGSDDGVVMGSEQSDPAVEDEPEREEVDPAVVMDASTDSATDEESGDDAEVWSSTRPDLERASADVENPDAETVRDGQFRCAKCGFTTPIEASSLREGDYCPECHQGMLVVEDA